MPSSRSIYPWMIAGALLLIGSIPYLFAYWMQDAQHLFSGYLHFPEDMDSYAAFANQAAQGHWLFVNPYELQPQTPSYFNLLWLISGKCQGLLGLSFGVILQVVRIIGGLALILACWRLLGDFQTEPAARKLGLILFAFASGFGVLLFLFRLSAPPPDLYTELFPFIQTAFVPHTALAHALLLLALSFALSAEREQSLRPAQFAGATLVLLGSFRAYDTAVGFVILGAFVAIRIIFVSEDRRSRLLRGLWMILPALLPIGYAAWLTRMTTGFSIWSMTNHYPPPDVFTMLLGLGIFVAGTLVWLVWKAVEKSRWSIAEQLLGIWLLSAWILMYSGLLPWAWRTCAAFATPHILATILVLARIPQRPLKVVSWMLVFAVALPTSVFVWHQKIEQSREQFVYYYQPPETIEALQWIGRERRGAHVLTHGHIGLKVPAYADAYSFLGHKDLTANLEEKRNATADLFSDKLTAKQALKLLELNRIDTIIWGPLDRREFTFSPDRLMWPKLYENGLVTIYGKPPSKINTGKNP